jgi:hypothetical protein
MRLLHAHQSPTGLVLPANPRVDLVHMRARLVHRFPTESVQIVLLPARVNPMKLFPVRLHPIEYAVLVLFVQPDNMKRDHAQPPNSASV